VTVTALTYTHLNGTWNFVNGYGNTSGTITFGTEELKCNWCHGNERRYGFVGIFSGHHVEGTYTEIMPGPNDLGLEYTYHHHKVLVMGTLNHINANHMELTDITSIDANSYKTTVGNADSCSQIATGLHLHYGDIIHLMRGGTALNIPSSQLYSLT
jgi:hypothetical protein